MAGIFAFMSKREGKRLLMAENPEAYKDALAVKHLIIGATVVQRVSFKPELNRENYMQTTGAKLYFLDNVALLSGYAYHGRDVMDLVRTYGLQAFDTEEEVVN